MKIKRATRIAVSYEKPCKTFGIQMKILIAYGLLRNNMFVVGGNHTAFRKDINAGEPGRKEGSFGL